MSITLKSCTVGATKKRRHCYRRLLPRARKCWTFGGTFAKWRNSLTSTEGGCCRCCWGWLRKNYKKQQHKTEIVLYLLSRDEIIWENHMLYPAHCRRLYFLWRCYGYWLYTSWRWNLRKSLSWGILRSVVFLIKRVVRLMALYECSFVLGVCCFGNSSTT